MATPTNTGWGGKLSSVLEGLKVPPTVPADNVVPLDRRSFDAIAERIRQLTGEEVAAQAEHARIAERLEQLQTQLTAERGRFVELAKDLGIA